MSDLEKLIEHIDEAIEELDKAIVWYRKAFVLVYLALGFGFLIDVIALYLIGRG